MTKSKTVSNPSYAQLVSVDQSQPDWDAYLWQWLVLLNIVIYVAYEAMWSTLCQVFK